MTFSGHIVYKKCAGAFSSSAHNLFYENIIYLDSAYPDSTAKVLH